MIEWPKKIYNKISPPFIRFCITNKISSNDLTILNHFITLTFGCYLFSLGSYIGFILGLLVCIINGFLDYADGNLARELKSVGKYGIWLDSGFDVIVQNAVMGAIAIGCYKIGINLIWIILFFIGNAANNFVSFNYNVTFGFDSDKGNSVFRDFMDKRKTPINLFFKSLIDPTCSYSALILFTFRYWIALGCLFNIMPLCFKIITVIGNIKWFIMYCIYGMHLQEKKSLYVLHGLAMLDEERQEFYKNKGDDNA